MTYRITLTEEQMRVTMIALEEYFRLRMGQDDDFCRDMAEIDRVLRKEELSKNDWEKQFDQYLHRRAHLRELMKAFFRIAFEPIGYLTEKTDDMMIAECIWDVIRFALGQSRWDRPFAIGKEPVPKIEKEEMNA